LLLPPPDEALTLTPLHEAVLAALDDGQALFFRSLADRVAAALPDGAALSGPAALSGSASTVDDEALVGAVWELVWAGWLTNDTLAPLRAVLGGGGAHRSRAGAPRTRYRRFGGGTAGRFGSGRPALPSRTGPPTVAGRWSRLPERDTDPTRRAA